MPQLPRSIVYLLYFCCIANRLICCSLYGMKEESGAKVKRENNLQGDRSFNNLKNILLLFSSLAQLVKKQITVLGRFGVHICITSWVEVNVNKVYMPQAALSWRLLHTFNIVYKTVPPFVIFAPCWEILATGLTVVNVTAISWMKFSSFGRHKTKNNWYTIFSISGCPALQHSVHIFSAKPAYINALRQTAF